MKKKITTAVLALMVIPTFAEVINSDFDVRHNSIIENSVTQECNKMIDLTVIETKIEEDRVDQGIVDYTYTTLLSGKQIYDQGMFDYYEIKVVSNYYDGYDHETGHYGWYRVTEVECVDINL